MAQYYVRLFPHGTVPRTPLPEVTARPERLIGSRGAGLFPSVRLSKIQIYLELAIRLSEFRWSIFIVCSVPSPNPGASCVFPLLPSCPAAKSYEERSIAY